jgi:hypothetical protein
MPRVLKTGRIQKTRVLKTARVVKTGRVPDTLFGDILRLTQLRPSFIASGHITLSGVGKVLSIHDLNNDAHVLTNANTSQQCDFPVVHADYNNQLCLTFTVPDLKNYSSNIPGIVNYMHDGSGGEFFVVNTPTAAGTSVLVGSRNISGRGFTLGRSTSPASFFYVITAANGFAISQTDPTNSWLQDVPTYINPSYAIFMTPDATVRRRGTTLTSGNQSIAPEAGSSSQALRLGSDASNFFRGRWRSLLFFPPLSTTQRSLVQQWIQQDTGIAP